MFVYWFELAKELNENRLLRSLLDAVIAKVRSGASTGGMTATCAGA